MSSSVLTYFSVRCIWTKGVTIGKILYILTRYGPVIRAISNFIGKPSDSTQWTFRESKWDGGAPRVYVMILLGLYAMLGGKRRVMWLFWHGVLSIHCTLGCYQLAVDLTQECVNRSTQKAMRHVLKKLGVALTEFLLKYPAAFLECMTERHNCGPEKYNSNRDIRWGMWGRVIMLMWRTRGYLCLKSRVYDADLILALQGAGQSTTSSIRRLGGGFYLSEVGE
ncbi:hypothetical protein DFP72DRAFT_863228 [Ephemerocybe angulata]|uniref:Uncharacterized protein n=1 Tax=Ephemerocybe angulata TaxID=980116 RepID=A0A8H6LSW9_9AGAR|nr:hypothetical protein DFP72DRAFT_863228 [Tulosesus angulatus]